MAQTIRAVLFDSGDTLLKPIGGSWWPRPALLKLLSRLAIQVDPARMEAALDIGMRFLDENHFVADEAEEIAQFARYHRIVLRELGVSAQGASIAELARGEIFALGQEPFSDTRETLAELCDAGLKLGIVSNAWPSLDRVYRELGLRGFFDAFVISSKLGCLKPNARIYREAINLIGIPPAQTLFVDDDADYVRAARELGICALRMCRYSAPDAADAIANLAELRARILSGSVF